MNSIYDKIVTIKNADEGYVIELTGYKSEMLINQCDYRYIPVHEVYVVVDRKEMLKKVKEIYEYNYGNKED